MILIKHELRRGRGALIIWTAAIGMLMAVCVGLFPEMRTDMEGVTELFASMGAFTAAFGMDRLSLGTFAGFYAVECGNILGLGGAFYACLMATAALAGEERGGTAEFLLTHPLRRARVVTEKLAAVFLQIAVLNAVLLLILAVSAPLIGETVPWRELGRLHLAHFLLQLELACICFGLGAFLRRGGAGVGIGLAAFMYFFNLMANISDQTAFLKYITPYAYADGADILTVGLDGKLILLGTLYAALGVAAAYVQYTRKDIR